MDEAAKLLAEHYQKTFELTYKLWQQRNRLFLLLLAVVAVATLLTFDMPTAGSPSATHSVIISWIASQLDITDAAGLDSVRSSLSYGILQSVLMLSVFYLMVNLYHRTTYVFRNYSYLAALEARIRDLLGSRLGEHGFTRESDFYWEDRRSKPMKKLVKWAFIFLLGALLLAFFISRACIDFGHSDWLLVVADVCIAIPTLAFFSAYVRVSVSQDDRAPARKT